MMVFCPSRMRGLLVLGLIGVVAFVGACSSDNFSGVGGTMPTDVSQDSIEIALPPIYPVVAEVITPLDTIPVEDRPALYIGTRAGGAWRGTPLVRFDVGDSLVQEKLPLDWADVKRVDLRIRGMVQADDAAVVREVRAYELLAPLSPADALVGDVTTLLGAELGTATWNKGAEGVIADLPLDVVEAWFNSGTHNGIALVHVAPDTVAGLYSSFAGYAGEEFRSSARLYGGISVSPPELHVELSEEALSFEVPVLLDLGHLERLLPGPQDLQIGSYIERRLWINFDLSPDIVSVDATINSGFLVLQIRDDFTMQVRPFSSFGTTGAIIINQQVRAWEAARSEAGDDPSVEEAHGRGNREVIGGSADFNPDPGGGDPDEDLANGELRIDVTEYVQRQVNEIVPDDLPDGTAIGDVGLLIAFVSEQLDLDLGVFYGLDASDDLKPRLEITYTPPADSWQ